MTVDSPVLMFAGAKVLNYYEFDVYFLNYFGIGVGFGFNAVRVFQAKANANAKVLLPLPPKSKRICQKRDVNSL